MSAAKKRQRPSASTPCPDCTALTRKAGAPLLAGETTEQVAERIRRKFRKLGVQAKRDLEARLDAATADARAQVHQAAMLLDAWLGEEGDEEE